LLSGVYSYTVTTIHTNFNFPSKNQLIEVCHRMLPNILSDRQQRSLAKQLENEKQAAAEAKRQTYAQRKEHERSIVQQSSDRERQLKESNLHRAMKYLDTFNSGSAKHKLAKFHLIFVERSVSHTV